ncbi:MAG: MoxR family ATPase [Phycisphaerales bacterium]|nr:MoxR family ATPase [Phycisphaerales bacterium]
MIENADLAGLEKLKRARDAIREQMAGTIVGQEEVVEQLLVCLFARGHCILEGVPGLAKTLMIRTLAQCLSLRFNRIQFTPDLMPSDITGTEVMYEDRGSGGGIGGGGERAFKFIAGPIFTHVLLADEINRTPPKTQSALLEGMGERQVSVGGKRHVLPNPFFTLATQNPIEQEGTYPLPEAQLDRFLMKILVRYPTEEEEKKIYRLTSTGNPVVATTVLSEDEMLELQGIVHKVPVSDFCVNYVSNLVRSTRHGEAKSPQFIKDWVQWGAGPRGGQALIATAQARAALDGRPEVDIADIKAMATAVLRHRIVLNYNAEAQGQTAETVIRRLIDTIPSDTAAEQAHERINRVLKA